jgi:hypothetical protein
MLRTRQIHRHRPTFPGKNVRDHKKPVFVLKVAVTRRNVKINKQNQLSSCLVKKIAILMDFTCCQKEPIIKCITPAVAV